MTNPSERSSQDEHGATAVEYGLISRMIVLAMLGALQGVAGETIGDVDTIHDADSSTAADKQVEALSMLLSDSPLIRKMSDRSDWTTEPGTEDCKPGD